MPNLRLEAAEDVIYQNGIFNKNARLISAHIGSGEQGLPQFQYVIEPGGRTAGRPELQDMSLIGVSQSEDEAVVGHGSQGDRVVGFGICSAQSVQLDAHGTFFTYTSRLEPHHFGNPLREAWFWDANSGAPLGVDLPTIFNPEFEDVIVPNMSQKRNQKLGCGLFIDPQSSRSDAAKEYADSPQPQFWTLAEAVLYLCETLNDESLVFNPALSNLKQVLKDDGSLLRNFHCEVGPYLPALLDAILSPFGYTWTIDLVARGKRQIRVYQLNDGPAASIDLQPVGQQADVDASNIKSLSLNADVSSGAFNDITILGEHEHYESTFELVPGWKSEHDDVLAQDATTGVINLTKESEEWTGKPYLESVWRRWVLNEGGDYNGFRKDQDKPYSFDDLFGKGNWITRRRRLLPCLSRKDDGEPQGHAIGVFIEWSNDGGDTWYKLDQMRAANCRVLESEIGIYFNGPLPPYELMFAGRDDDGNFKAKVRVTATVESDKRVSNDPTNSKTILQSRKSILINAPSKYKYRQRGDKSIFNGYLNEIFTEEKIESDDRKLMNTGSGNLLAQNNVGDIQGQITLPGVNYPKLQIGQTVRGIPGRGVDFGTAGDGSRYPSIIALQFNLQDQTTDVVLGTYRGSAI